jgi:hypothetical protein
MWVRHEAYLSAIVINTPEALVPGPQPYTRVTGDDFEIGLLIGRAGYRRVYVPQVKLKHVIGRHRVGTAHFAGHIIQTIRSACTFQSRYELRRFGLA